MNSEAQLITHYYFCTGVIDRLSVGSRSPAEPFGDGELELIGNSSVLQNWMKHFFASHSKARKETCQDHPENEVMTRRQNVDKYRL